MKFFLPVLLSISAFAAPNKTEYSGDQILRIKLSNANDKTIFDSLSKNYNLDIWSEDKFLDVFVPNNQLVSFKSDASELNLAVLVSDVQAMIDDESLDSGDGPPMH